MCVALLSSMAIPSAVDSIASAWVRTASALLASRNWLIPSLAA